MRCSLFFLLTAVIFISLLASSCANIVPPSGGPRDSLPPRLLRVEPKDSSLHFASKNIVFNFDEYVDLQDVSNNLLFTPTFAINPEVSVKLKTVTVRFRDSLLPNTTYVLNFGNAIKDINEGNVLSNFRYVFSTGSALDSLTLDGKVILAENGKIDTTLTMILHTNLEDSAVRKERPKYIARLDGSGHFRFTNLPAGRYAVYAISDAGSGRQYRDTAKQLFAFSDTAIVVAPNQKPDITLYAYRNAAPPKTGTATTKAPADKRLRITSNLASSQQDLLDSLVFSFDRPLRYFDSSRVRVSTDSTFTPLTAYSFNQDSSKKQVVFKTQWKEKTVYHLIFDKDFAEDTLGRKLLKNDTLTFVTRKVSDYGNITLRVKNIDASLNPVLQFIQNETVVFATPVGSGRFTRKMFQPGEYGLRLLFDTNSNGKWDPGHFFGDKRQPEKVKPLERKLVIKPNAANEFEIVL